MTRTEDELRTLLHAPIEAGAASRVMPRAVGAEPGPAPRRHPWRIGVVSALVVVVVGGAVAAVLAVRPERRNATPTVAVSPDHIPVDALILGFDPASGLHVDSVSLDASGQTVSASGSATGQDAFVSVAPAGRSAATPVPGRGTVMVGDAVAHWYSPYEPGALGGPQSDVLGWESGGFAFSAHGSPFGDGDTYAVAAARAVRVIAPVPVRVPIRVSAWPDGLDLLGLSIESGSVSIAVAPHVDVKVLGSDLASKISRAGDPVVIDGRTWRWDAAIGVLSWFAADRIVLIGPETYDEAQFVSRSAIEALAAAMTFAPSFTDTSTWFDSTTALLSTSSSTSPSPSVPDDRPTTLRADSTVISFPAGSGYHAGLTTVSTDEQSVEVEPETGAVVGTVVVGRGAVPPAVGSKPAVDLGGGVAAVWVTAPGGEGTVPVGDALAWSVAGLTVTVSPSFDGATDADVEAVARAVVIGAPVALRVPVSVSSWPSGWSLDAVTGTDPHRDGAPATTDKDVRIDLALAGTAGTAVSIDSAGLGSYGADTGTAVEIAGRTWRWDATANSFTWHGPDRFVAVTSFNAGIGRADLQAVVAGMSVAPSFADETTWFDATTAFPH